MKKERKEGKEKVAILWTDQTQTSKSLICLTQTFCDGDTFAHSLSISPEADGRHGCNFNFLHIPPHIHAPVAAQRRRNSHVIIVFKQDNGVVAVIYFDARTGAFSWESALSMRISSPRAAFIILFFSPGGFFFLPLPFFIGLSPR